MDERLDSQSTNFSRLVWSCIFSRGKAQKRKGLILFLLVQRIEEQTEQQKGAAGAAQKRNSGNRSRIPHKHGRRGFNGNRQPFSAKLSAEKHFHEGGRTFSVIERYRIERYRVRAANSHHHLKDGGRVKAGLRNSLKDRPSHYIRPLGGLHIEIYSEALKKLEQASLEASEASKQFEKANSKLHQPRTSSKKHSKTN